MSRASEYRSRKRERIHKLYVEETGETFLVRPIGFDTWIMAGRMPESLAREVLSAWGQMQAAEQMMSEWDVDKIISGFQMMRDLICDASVSPKIITGEKEPDPDKDEIHFIELDPAERLALFNCAMTGKGAEIVPGGVTAEAVARFPEGGERSQSIPVSENG